MQSVNVQTHEEFGHRCQELATTEPEATHKIASNLLAMGEGYYHDACSRARKSFNVALGAGVVGALFFFGAATLVVVGQADRATITVVSGGMIEVLSGVVFVLHFQAVKQFGYFHVCLERMTRYMVANSVCTNIKDDVKRDETRSLLVKAMLDAPMLPLFDLSERETRDTSAASAAKAKSVGA